MVIEKARGFARNYLFPLILLGITLGLGCKTGSLEGRVQDPSTLKKGQVVKDPGYFRIMYIGNILDLEEADPSDKGKMWLGDIDSDNDLDLCIVDNEGHAFIYENQGIRPVDSDSSIQEIYKTKFIAGLGF